MQNSLYFYLVVNVTQMCFPEIHSYKTHLSHWCIFPLLRVSWSLNVEMCYFILSGMLLAHSALLTLT